MQCNESGVGGEAAAPILFREAPADFNFGNAVEFKGLQAAVADEAAIGFLNQFPKAEAERSQMVLLTRDGFANLVVGARLTAIDVAHNVWIGEDGARGGEVIGFPGAQPKAFGFEMNLHRASP